jgi:predicted ATPase
VVGAAAAEQPVVLLLDDAHWLDGASLDAVHSLARDLADLPVMIVLTALRQPPRDEIDLIRARLGRDAAGAAITLEPLGPAGLLALTQWAMPSFGAVEQDRLARRIAADSAGLPLLAVELLHAVALGLDLNSTPRAWPEPHRTLDQTLPGDLPDSVVAAIRIGFRRLSKDAQTALAAAAVLGDRAEPIRLAAATGLAPDALATALDEAEWQRWLTADGRGYAFVAGVARDVVARDMVTAGQRRRFLEQA